MTDWLYDTFMWTGLLIAAVLLLRRPVARHFGPQVAYALWALPLARFMLPPLVLPASLAPVSSAPAGEPLVILLADAPQTASAPVAEWLVPLTLVLWLGGAALLLAWRARDYLAMRRELLAEARPMGEAGRVRLVETPAVASPVAFGVRDKVVALPPGFMVQPDRAARDLAIAHELAHHAGRDLLANLAAQPLLALHWFNPLAWWGWRAMRSDQEAACDARVIAGRERSERAAYAQVIAGFAAGPRLALAAPMACPVLGEKSIIHRLRSLTMTDVSSTRRRLGLGAIAASALLALPLTASISYAQAEAPTAPDRPVASETTAPDAPRRMVRIRREHPAEGASEIVGDEAINSRRVIVHRNGEDFAGFDEAEHERMMAEIEAELEQADEEIARAMAEHGRAMAESNRAVAESQRAVRLAMRDMPQMETGCDNATEVVSHRQLADGRQVMVICQRAAQLQARNGLREAQRAIRGAEGLSPETRDMILRELDAEIDQLENEQAAYVSRSDAKAIAAVMGLQARMAASFASFAPPAPPLPPAPVVAPAPVAPPAPVLVIRASVAVPAVKPASGRTI